jgi:hypothetical protein
MMTGASDKGTKYEVVLQVKGNVKKRNLLETDNKR